jgi:hypothetical protein
MRLLQQFFASRLLPSVFRGEAPITRDPSPKPWIAAISTALLLWSVLVCLILQSLLAAE